MCGIVVTFKLFLGLKQSIGGWIVVKYILF